MEKCKEREPTIVLPTKTFTNTGSAPPADTMEMIQQSQNYHVDFMEGNFKMDHIIIPPDKDLKQHLMSIIHDHPTGGHPGWDKTILATKNYYY